MNDPHYFQPEWVRPTDDRLSVDVCVYGATSAGVIAAVEAVRLGKSVALLQPGHFVGGLSSGGLGWTDHGHKDAIGGVAREFYRRVGGHYGLLEEFQFEPHVADAVFEQLLHEHDITVRKAQFLDRIEKHGTRIQAISMLGGLHVQASVFIDATYEGDLMAKAGVGFAVGREANAVYGETVNGIQVHAMHQFSHPVDPYVREGDPSSGLLPGIVADDLSTQTGCGDSRIQAYNFRVCMTDDPALKIDWQRPDRFAAEQYVLAGRWLRGDKDAYNELVPTDGPHAGVPVKFDLLPNKTANGFHKTDTNNHGAVSSDFIGMNHDWPQGCYEARERVFQSHVNYQQGLYWYLANGDDVPARYREAYTRWGLPRDEFSESGHWPHQLYIREARRMIGAYVITERDCRGMTRPGDAVGVGSYGMDSHNCTRFLRTENGRARVMNEGDVQLESVPYAIPYRSITPKAAECTNLLVPVCISASHIAYGSVRMEPVFMILGHSAAAAACLAIDRASTVQDVPYESIKRRLLDEHQVLD